MLITNLKIVLLLCYASDETRVNSDEHRSKTQGFFQATPEDIVKCSGIYWII